MARNGYVWWYVDAFSDDRRHGITLIAFIGNVFSPYYAWARTLGRGDPTNHCALNVALYGERAKHWTLTERGRADLDRTCSSLAIGPSAISWQGDVLQIDIDEVTVPVPSRIRGTVRVHPRAVTEHFVALDPRKRHWWSPIAPSARIDVNLQNPALRWSGEAYFDSNSGAEPLEDAFSHWHWSRAHTNRDTLILYDAAPRNGTAITLAKRADGHGHVEDFEAPLLAPLPTTGWGVARATRADTPQGLRVLRTLENAPFYARSIISSSLCGETTTAMHESLSLDRFRTAWVKLLLPFRMPRTTRRIRR